MLVAEEKAYLEEERSRILSRVDDLKHRVSELERQLQETKQEVKTCASTMLMKYMHFSLNVVAGFRCV